MAAIRSIQRTLVTGANVNYKLWTEWFWAAWDSLRLDEKLIWLIFLSYTISILTLFELLILR